jgi:hypothetical protein
MSAKTIVTNVFAMVGAEAVYHFKVLLLELAFQNLTYIAKTNSKNKQQLTSHLF